LLQAFGIEALDPRAFGIQPDLQLVKVEGRDFPLPGDPQAASERDRKIIGVRLDEGIPGVEGDSGFV